MYLPWVPPPASCETSTSTGLPGGSRGRYQIATSTTSNSARYHRAFRARYQRNVVCTSQAPQRGIAIPLHSNLPRRGGRWKRRGAGGGVARTSMCTTSWAVVDLYPGLSYLTLIFESIRIPAPSWLGGANGLLEFGKPVQTDSLYW